MFNDHVMYRSMESMFNQASKLGNTSEHTSDTTLSVPGKFILCLFVCLLVLNFLSLLLMLFTLDFTGTYKVLDLCLPNYRHMLLQVWLCPMW